MSKKRYIDLQHIIVSDRALDLPTRWRRCIRINARIANNYYYCRLRVLFLSSQIPLCPVRMQRHWWPAIRIRKHSVEHVLEHTFFYRDRGRYILYTHTPTIIIVTSGTIRKSNFSSSAPIHTNVDTRLYKIVLSLSFPHIHNTHTFSLSLSRRQ